MRITHILSQDVMYRSSHPEVFYKKDIFRNFAKFTEKHVPEILFNKVAVLFFTEHLWWLLLNVALKDDS